MALFVSYTVCPVHDGVCVCVASEIYFYTEAIYGVCLYSVILNTVTTPAKHEHIERMEETRGLLSVYFCMFLSFPFGELD